MMRTLGFLAAGSALACGMAVATAAPTQKAVPAAETPMQVHIVRSGHPGCEPNCLQWIAAQGKIGPGSVGLFRKVLAQLGDRKLPILIDSGGGSVNDAMAIGRMVRARELDVVVTRTVFAPCAPADGACRKVKTGGELRGLAQAKLSKCASSCAFILAAGRRRFVGQETYVGVHQITMIMRMYRILTRRSFGAPVEVSRTFISEHRVGQKSPQTQSTYGSIKRYFAEMGIGEEVMPILLSTPPDRMRWLTPDELKATRLATHTINGEQLITGLASSAPPPAAVPKTFAPRGGVCMKIGEWAVSCDKHDANTVPWPNMRDPAPPPAPADAGK